MNVSSVKNLNGEVLSAVQDASLTNVIQTNSGNWNTVTDKLDTSSFSTVIANFYPNSNPAGYITGVSIPESATWNEVSTTVQTNSAQWAEGGAISSYTTDWCHDVPPYGDRVINSLNDKFISAFISNSADRANFANNANNANSANYAETVNETYLENKGFTRNLSSEYGTISVIHNNIIESTNSAIVRTGNEGFVSAFEGKSIGPEGNGTATYSWDKSLPNTIISLQFGWTDSEILTYSANTNLTGEIVLPTGVNTQTINIPNATEFKVWSNRWIGLENATVSAADQFETIVGELAWASALPTYEYDTTNKISAINGSALAGGSEVPSGTMNVSGLEYNAVNEISAYNGSAIAQYGAEKQWLQHDDTIVHVANSAQYALGVNLSAVAQLLGVDETVLFEGTSANPTLSESIDNFKKVDIVYTYWPDEYTTRTLYGWSANPTFTEGWYNEGGTFGGIFITRLTANDSHTVIGSDSNRYWNPPTGTTLNDATSNFKILKVIGIGRKS